MEMMIIKERVVGLIEFHMKAGWHPTAIGIAKGEKERGPPGGVVKISMSLQQQQSCPFVGTSPNYILFIIIITLKHGTKS